MREPAERAYFEELVRPLLGDGIEYVGEVDRAGKVDLLGGSGRPAEPDLLAGAVRAGDDRVAGLRHPVLSFANGAAPEIVRPGVTGALCCSLDEMVEQVATVDHLDRSACRRDVDQRFSTERMVTDYLRVYERAAAR